jgi:thiamine-phosphate pyrophosphorylase
MPLALKSRLYYLTPAQPLPLPQLLARVRQMLAAGVDLVQYRAKRLPTRQRYQEIVALLEVTRPAGVPLIVNDSVGLALAAGAEGAHIGQEDLPVAVARRLLGPYAFLGVSVEGPEQARQAERDGASYVACGPIFPSTVKPESPAIGPMAVAAIRRAVTVPVCAIGGITVANLPALQEARPDLLAVITALNDVPDPGAAAREFIATARGLWG